MYSYRSVIILISLFVFFSCVNLQKKQAPQLLKGDLLFQDLDADSISNAIETVTGGTEKLSFSHIGILDYDKDGNPMVLEAISKGVSLTPLKVFLQRSANASGKSKVVVARLKPKYRDRINDALNYGKLLLDKPYDNVYVMGDSNYYCSELIYEIFDHTKDTTKIFQLHPMTFKDSKTGDYLPFWKKYYQNLGVEIPEGMPGLNPNGMFQSSHIDIVYRYDKE
ncbi:YiiX/YebB-like N1pC/P60 family cysteine hydrolase [Ancylomarina longa]|nr:YiiX/YebB-like N1pC/P60 family cysteine hydrolase [Ancylomarina longa]